MTFANSIKSFTVECNYKTSSHVLAKIDITIYNFPAQILIIINDAENPSLKSLSTALQTKFSTAPLSTNILSVENTRPNLQNPGQISAQSENQCGWDERSSNLSVKVSKKLGKQSLVSWNLSENVDESIVERNLFDILKTVKL